MEQNLEITCKLHVIYTVMRKQRTVSSVYEVGGTCSRDETVEAAKVAEQIDDKPINTDTWKEGETATIR